MCSGSVAPGKSTEFRGKSGSSTGRLPGGFELAQDPARPVLIAGAGGEPEAAGGGRGRPATGPVGHRGLHARRAAGPQGKLAPVRLQRHLGAIRDAELLRVRRVYLDELLAVELVGLRRGGGRALVARVGAAPGGGDVA